MAAGMLLRGVPDATKRSQRVHGHPQVMASPPTPAVRLEAMLVLGRLAARNRACQQDAVREGVVPVLVDMMMHGELSIKLYQVCIQPAE